MALIDDLMAAIVAKHDEKAKALADKDAALTAKDAEIAALTADKEKLTADLAAAVAAAQAAPVLPPDAASGPQVQAAIDAVKAL